MFAHLSRRRLALPILVLVLLAALLSPVAVNTSPAGAQGGGGWSFISIPDLFNADYADLSGGADQDIAAVFSGNYANGLVAAANWTPAGPNSMNAEFAAVLHQAMDSIAASTRHNPELALIAGDLVGGRWPQNRTALKSMFGTPSTTLDQELDRASASYYSWIRKLFNESGIDTVVAAIGDHDIGDNPWTSAAKANAVNRMKIDFGDHMVDPIFANLSGQDASTNASWTDIRFGPGSQNDSGIQQYDEASFVYQQNNVLFLNVDVFRFEGGATLGGQGAVAAEVTGAHLAWVRDVLERAQADGTVDHVIVQGHTPVLGPVNSNRSSQLLLNGGVDSELWQTIAQFGTNVGGKVRSYFAGEVHATTTILDPSSGIVQISHGALVQAIRQNFDNSDPTYLAVEVSTDGTLIEMTEFTIDLDRRGDTSVVWEADRPVSTTHDTFVSGPRQIGSLTIDVSTAELNLSANGSLAVAREVPSNATAAPLIVQTGRTTVTQNVQNAWFVVEFDQAMVDPIVVMGPLTVDGIHPAHPRVRNVTNASFEFRIEEWDYLDGRHTKAESVSWIAAERGTHVLRDGSVLQAGSTSVDDRVVEVNLDSVFDRAPILIGQVAQYAGPDPVTHRFSDVSASDFSVQLQEEEAKTGGHGLELFHWIGFSQGNFDSFATGTFDVSHIAKTATLPGGSGGVTLADMQSMNGLDPAQLRILNETDTALTIFVEEEQSLSDEIVHKSESVGWVQITAAIYS